MKALIRSKWLVLLSALSLALIFLPLQASAHCHHHRWHYSYFKWCGVKKVPTATCSTYATNTPLPQYVCCKSVYKSHHKVHVAWRHQWVANSCQMADANATYDRGCSVRSVVHGTQAPIIANCQFSSNTLQ